jgi:diguanylate cyclase (GGDEF)-like protein
LEKSENRAEELIVLLRNAGRATRAHRIESEHDLTEKLNEHNWDLLLGVEEASGLKLERVIEIVQELEKDVPIIMIAADRDPKSITRGMRMGALDVALENDEERLALIAKRELGNLQHRRLRRKAEVEVREVDRRNQLLLSTSSVAIAYVHDGMHIYTNSTYGQLFGYENPADFAGIPIIDLIASEDHAIFKSFLTAHKKEGDSEPHEFTCVTSDDERVLTNLSLSHASYDGESCTQVIFEPMTQDAELADRIKEISNQDLLTGLYNRRYFIEHLDTSISHASEGSQSYILLYISVDNFSRLQTDAGISVADLILGDLASLLREKVDEKHIMARFSDDVFTLLYVGDKDTATKLGKKICSTIDDHLSEVSGKSYHATVSIGLSLITENAPSSEEIVSRARHAANSIEDGNGISFYHPPKPAKAAQGRGGSKVLTDDMIMDLVRRRLEDNTFKILFQPMINLHGNDDDEQFEVLLRLPDLDNNDLIPAQFLDHAAKAGLLDKLDRWVILQSIKVLSVHRASGSKARLFINVTHKSMSDNTFLPWMSVALKAARLPSDAIIFQIHENDATAYIKYADRFAKGMAQLHCKTSINHFGCSLNPFNLLKHLTPDYVKLDRSFTENLEDSKEKQDDLNEMVTSLHKLGVLTAISGVEDPMVLATLWQAGINYIQGNYISNPLETLDYDFAAEDI